MGLNDGAIRLGIFLLVFSVMALWEMAAPKRAGSGLRQRRWTTNLLMVVIDGVTLRILVPITAVWTADFAQTHGIGLFNLVRLPAPVTGILAFVVLDFAIWLQHVLSHKIPFFWRLHAVHHADIDVDLTTGIRFHPLEIVISMIWKICVVLALGAPAYIVFVFEVVLNGSAMFNHANVRLPKGLDAVLRLLVVTPDMHRVHHSVILRETDSNYGFNLSIWDRMFGTYRAEPKAGHRQMTIGLQNYQSEEPTRLGWSLLLPFKGLFQKR